MSGAVLLAVPKGTFTDAEIRTVGWEPLYEDMDGSHAIFRREIPAASAPPQQWECSYSSKPPSEEVTRSGASASAGAAYNYEILQARAPAGSHAVTACVAVEPKVVATPQSGLSKVRLDIKRLSVSLKRSEPASADAADDFLDNWSIAIVPEWEGEKHLLAFGPVKEADKVNKTRQDQINHTYGAAFEASANPKLTLNASQARGGIDTFNLGVVDSESFTCDSQDQDATFSWKLQQWVDPDSGRAKPCKRDVSPLDVSADIPEPVSPIFAEYTYTMMPPPFTTQQLPTRVHKLSNDAGDPGYAEWINVPTKKIHHGDIKWGVYGFVCSNSWAPVDVTAMSSSCLLPLLHKLRGKRVYQCTPMPMGPVRWGEIGLHAAS